MADWYTYQKKRKEFGKDPKFSNSETKMLGLMGGAEEQRDGYIERNPNFAVLDNIAEMSENSVNTERVRTADKVMNHKEGGWPKEIDATENDQTTKWRKKIDRDTKFTSAVQELCTKVDAVIQQNNQIDLFEEYFYEEEPEHFVESLSAKTLMLFKDHKDSNSTGPKRSVSKVFWHPEGPTKLAVSYAIQRFQQTPDNMPSHAYIWDVNKPNSPERILNTPSPAITIAYNHKSPDILAGGCYNGMVAIWDVKVKPGSTPQLTVQHQQLGSADRGHYDPVTDLVWLSTKTQSEFVTTSTDGRMYWWDTRMPNAPTGFLVLNEGFGADQKERVVGGTRIEFNPDAGPMKYLVGTEQGSTLIVNKKPNKPAEIGFRYGLEQGRHYGPIYALQRNPLNNKFFLSVGDWSAKIWQDDLKTPIIRTRYHAAPLTDGCWSPTRQGVFFLSRKDGWLDVWDYFYRQNEIAFTHKVSDSALTCMKLNYNPGANQGKYLAIGDQDGTVTLLELCESLYQSQNKEKDVINEIFERETRKEKTLDLIRRQADTKKAPKESKGVKDAESKKAEAIKKVEDDFFSHIGKNEPGSLQEGGEETHVQREDQDERKEDEDERPSEQNRNDGGNDDGGDAQGEAEKKSDPNASQEKSVEQKGDLSHREQEDQEQKPKDQVQHESQEQEGKEEANQSQEKSEEKKDQQDDQ
mmetsp:Transcript_51698/g.59382  ORF Transcript_51698/g.59382 Transcript_51698/m.59382 type:complete len:692 (+) Transcript_51698:39-2114(+)